MTGNYLTDVTNASRTMLMSLSSCTWDDRICQAFGLQSRWLARIVPCDHDFGRTDLDGLLPRAVPILAVMGDSHAAFYAQHCTKPGDTKATYGTGSSVMMHIGDAPKSSTDGIVTSVGYQYRGKTVYAYEGNINDSGAVITWLKDRIGLICSPDETEALALAADPEDVTCLVPAFSGLSAPYHDPDASAIYTGMSRLTGRNELVRAALDSIAFQIRDITACMEAQAGLTIQTLHADGGAAQNRYLMQFQSDLLGRPVHVSAEEDLSAYGVGLMALALEPCADVGTEYTPLRDDAFRQKKCAQWAQAVAQCRRH